MELVTDYIQKENPEKFGIKVENSTPENIFVNEIIERIIGFAEIDLPFYPYEVEGGQMLNPDGAVSLPWGQQLKNIVSLRQSFITPPLLFPQEKMSNNVHFYPIPKDIEELMLKRINKLNNIVEKEVVEESSILNVNILPNSTDTVAIAFQLKNKT